MKDDPQKGNYSRVMESMVSKVSNSLSHILRGNGLPVSARQHRKLASILYADVHNYSGHCEKDEDGTHLRLIEHMDFFAHKIREYHGTVAHCEGDALLAEFGDVSSVLECAIGVQNKFSARNTNFPADSRIEFRIGVNIGEVICDRGDIYGNAVNVAARLESLAEPGGITISESVKSSIGNRLAVNIVPLGEQLVKNIDSPVNAYRLDFQGEEPPGVSRENVVPFPAETRGEPVPG